MYYMINFCFIVWLYKTIDQHYLPNWFIFFPVAVLAFLDIPERRYGGSQQFHGVGGWPGCNLAAAKWTPVWLSSSTAGLRQGPRWTVAWWHTVIGILFPTVPCRNVTLSLYSHLLSVRITIKSVCYFSSFCHRRSCSCLVLLGHTPEPFSLLALVLLPEVCQTLMTRIDVHHG